MHKYVLMLSCLPSLCGCHSNDFIAYSPGLEYTIIGYGQADHPLPGETIKMHVKQVYRDSVLSNTRDSLPFYQKYDSLTMSKDAYAIFGQTRLGDSVIFKALADSAFKNKWPAFAKKGEYLYTHVKIEGIFGVKQDFRDDLKKEMEKKRVAWDRTK